MFYIEYNIGMGRVIVVTSGKGGVGKTTTVAHIGMVLSKFAKVALVDADIGLNNLDVTLGLETSIVYDLSDVIEGRARLNQALLRDPICQNMYVLASGKTIKDTDISTDVFRRIIEELSRVFEYVLIDCPAGIEEGFHRAIAAATECIIVTTPHVSAIRDADKISTMTLNYGLKCLGVVVCRLKNELVKSGKMMSAASISTILRLELLGSIPEDDKMTALSLLGRVGIVTKATKAYEDIAKKLLSKEKIATIEDKWYQKLAKKLKMAK